MHQERSRKNYLSKFIASAIQQDANPAKKFHSSTFLAPIAFLVLDLAGTLSFDDFPRVGENGGSPERGPVAQLGARFHGMEEVVGSIPTRSTIFSTTYRSPSFLAWCQMVLSSLTASMVW
jgi:hypothetical protein